MNNKTAQLICVWCLVPFLVFITLGWWPIAGFIPPIAPDTDLQSVVALYQNQTGALRTGFMLMVLSAGFYVPFAAAVSAQIRRIEGCGPVLASAQLGAAVMVTTLIIIPPLIWSAAAYRPERAPELTQMLHDLGWICLIMPASPAMLQVASASVAALMDKSANPVFPRWTGYLGLWLAVIFIPGLLLTYFKTGAFAWNGLLAFWVPVSLFFFWITLMAVLTASAIGKQPENA